MKKVAIFASGSGTNAEAVIKALAGLEVAEVAVVVTNNPNAGVISRAQNLHVPVEVVTTSGKDVIALQNILKHYKVETILLLGYLKLLPKEIVDAYEGRIVNLHPALLPKYGGKGMYGINVHKAVAESDDAQSGLSLHRVSAEYDDGEVLAQETVDLPKKRTPQTVEKLVRDLEGRMVAPRIVELIESNQI